MESTASTSWWTFLAHEYHLASQQIDQFKIYWKLLEQAHQDFNITTEIGEKAFVLRHVADSLAVTRFIKPWDVRCLADVGSGGGFPGIPLAIAHQDMRVILIEVNHKKREFLESVIDRIGLSHAQVSSLDWRTFLRKTEYPIDLFCARASLAPDELLRIFKPSSVYRHAQLVYWASHMHEPSELEKQYMRETMDYRVGNRHRALVRYGL